MSEKPDLEELARRYLDLWQDQVTALATDEEFAAALSRLMEGGGRAATAGSAIWDFWQAALGLAGEDKGTSTSDDGAAGSSGRMRKRAGQAEARAAPPAGPSRRGHVDLDELARRLAALEERVSALETPARGRGGRAHAKPGKRRS